MKTELRMELIKMLLGEERTEEITAVKSEFTDLNKDLYGKYVIVRWYWSGVHFWKLVKRTEEEWVVLENSRRMWRFWNEKGIGLTATSLNWLSDRSENRICEAIPLIAITDKRIEELIPCSEKAIESIKNYRVAEQD